MAAREVVRTLTIRNRTEGAQEAARDLNEVKRAADGVVQASERTERQTLSNSRAFERLQRSVDPAYRSYRQFQSSIQTLSRAVEQSNTSLSEANRLATMAATRYGIAADEVRDLASAQMMLDRGYIASNRSLSSANDNIRLTKQQMMGLGYQVNDVATMLLMGASPFQIMASQGGQVYQVLGEGPGGIRGSLRALGSQLGSLATRLAPVGIAIASLGTGVAALRSEINETSDSTVSFGDVALGVWQMMADGFTSIFRGPIETVQGWWKTLWENVETFAVDEFNNIARNVTQLGNQIKFAVDIITNHWKGSVETIKDVWALLPAAVGDLAMQAVQNVLEGLNSMLKKAADGIDWVRQKVSSVTGYDLPLINASDETIPIPDNAWEGSASELGGRIRDNAVNTIAADLESFRRMQTANAGLADWNPFKDLKANAVANSLRLTEEELKELEKAARKAAREAEKLSEAYDGIVRGAEQFISAQGLERQSIGLTEEAANRLRYEQDMLNKAANQNIQLTPAQAAELRGLAGAMAEAEAQTTALERAFEFAKDTTKGFISDFRSGLEQGKGVLRSFGDAALGVLQKISDKLIDMAVDNLWGNAFSGASGGGGGILSSILGGLGNMVPGSQWSIAAGGGIGLYDSGGWTGSGNPRDVAGLVHREEFVVKAGPARRNRAALEAMNSNRPMPANGGGGTSIVELRMSRDVEARVLKQAEGQSVRISRTEADAAVKDYDEFRRADYAVGNNPA